LLTVDRIEKSFGNKKAVADLSLTLEEGRIFGMLGTNGAGKSTMLRLMSGILHPDAGSVIFDGQPVYENPKAKGQIC